MKKLKVAIVFFTILIIIICVILLIVKNKNTSDSQVNQEAEKNTMQQQSKIVTNQSMYFTVEACIDNYIEYIEKNDKASVYKLLDDSYIKEYNIKEDTVMNHINNIPTNANFDTKKMLLSDEDGENIQQYYVYGVIRTTDGKKINKQNIYLTVNIDLENMIYSIIPNVPDQEVFYE